MKKRRWAIQSKDGWLLDTCGAEPRVHDGTLLFATEKDAKGFIDSYIIHKPQRDELTPVRLRVMVSRRLDLP